MAIPKKFFHTLSLNARGREKALGFRNKYDHKKVSAYGAKEGQRQI